MGGIISVGNCGMSLKEFRIKLPFTVEEFKRGHMYMSSVSAEKASSVNSSDVRIIESQAAPQDIPEYTTCPFTFQADADVNVQSSFHHRELSGSSSIPSWARVLLRGKSVLTVQERSWHCFPFIKTVYNIPMFGERISVVVLSNHSDNVKLNNALNLPRDMKRKRIVEWINIADNALNPEEDPKLFQSIKTGRGPLKGNWMVHNFLGLFLCGI